MTGVEVSDEAVRIATCRGPSAPAPTRLLDHVMFSPSLHRSAHSLLADPAVTSDSLDTGVGVFTRPPVCGVRQIDQCDELTWCDLALLRQCE
jgi:hypothetical protein